jgi:lysozyme
MLEGIDISHWETVTDWPAVKGSGIRFVYLKATQGEKSVDRCFHKYRLACQTAGLAWGAYHFYDYRFNSAGQAEHFITTVGRKPSVWQDGERRVAELPARLPLLNALRTLIDILNKAYGSALLYTNPAMLKRLAPLPEWLSETPLWIAHYTPARQPRIAPFKKWLFWQYSDAGRIPGIFDAVDRDRFNGNEAELADFIC